jgi:hypothetical protein
MEPEKILQELKENFVQSFTAKGFTKLEAIESWDVVINTYKESLAKFSLSGVIGDYTELQILDYLENSGELGKIRKIAIKRLENLK